MNRNNDIPLYVGSSEVIYGLYQRLGNVEGMLQSSLNKEETEECAKNMAYFIRKFPQYKEILLQMQSSMLESALQFVVSKVQFDNLVTNINVLDSNGETTVSEDDKILAQAFIEDAHAHEFLPIDEERRLSAEDWMKVNSELIPSFVDKLLDSYEVENAESLIKQLTLSLLRGTISVINASGQHFDSKVIANQMTMLDHYPQNNANTNTESTHEKSH